MGTRNLAERELIQGVIKLAAAFVHDARSNPTGVEKNLQGARERLGSAGPAGPRLGVDLGALLDTLDARIAAGAPRGETEDGVPIERLERALARRARVRVPHDHRTAGS